MTNVKICLAKHGAGCGVHGNPEVLHNCCLTNFKLFKV